MEKELSINNLTDTQLALIIAEKVIGANNGGDKNPTEVIKIANYFLKWLKDNKK